MMSNSFQILTLSLALLLANSFTACRTIDGPKPFAAGIDRTSFIKADTDTDGKLSQTELAIHLHEEALAEFDLNDDRLISAAEWAAAKPSASEEDGHFNLLDKDTNGKVDQDEAVLYITEHVKFGDSFKEIDQNGDFHLHWQEFIENDPTSVDFVLFSTKL